MNAIRQGVLIGTVAALAGCASLGTQQPPEQRVGERALERQQALIEGDFEAAYRYLSPGYRANHSLEYYRARFGSAARWTDAEVRDVVCEHEDACTATMLVSYVIKVPRMPEREGRRPFEEDWVLADGEWWYLPDS